MTNYFYLFIVVIDLQFYLKGNSNIVRYGGAGWTEVGAQEWRGRREVMFVWRVEFWRVSRLRLSDSQSPAGLGLDIMSDISPESSSQNLPRSSVEDRTCNKNIISFCLHYRDTDSARQTEIEILFGARRGEGRGGMEKNVTFSLEDSAGETDRTTFDLDVPIISSSDIPR